VADRNEIEIIVTAEVDKALKGLRKTGVGAENLEKKTGNLNKGFSKLKAGMLGLAAVAAGALAVAFGKTIKLASDFEEANAKFGTTFRGVSKEANAMRKNLVDNYNLSTKAATELLANTGDLLSGFGFTGEKALELSGATNTLAADLASFANVPVAQASEAISKGLLGERESMKSLGIAISEADVQQQLLLNGKQDLTGMALKQAKAEATLQLAMKQSKNAIGDVSRTQNSLANRMRKAKAAFEDFQVVVGQKLIKQLAPTIEKFAEFSKSAEGLAIVDKSIKSLVTGIILLKTAAKVTFNGLKTQIKTLIEGFTTLKDFWTGIFTGDIKGAFNSLKDGALDVFNVQKEGAVNTAKIYKGAYDEITGVWKQTNAAQIEGTNLLVKKEKDAVEEIIAGRKRLTDEQKANLMEGLKTSEQVYGSTKDLADSLFQAQLNNVKEGSAKEKEIKKKQFKSNKAFGVVDSVISTITGIARAFKDYPFPASAIIGGVVGAAGAAQTAAIVSQPMPSFQQGIQHVPEDMIAKLHEGEGVLTKEENNDFSNNSNFAGANITVQANDPEEFAAAMSDYNRTRFGANA
jgi:hypothetical protein